MKKIIACFFALIFVAVFAFASYVAYLRYDLWVNRKKDIVKETFYVGPFSRTEREELFALINQAIETGLDGKELVLPDLKKFPLKWQQKRGVYVTLNIGDKLRGCQGTKEAEKPFVHAVMDAAYRAAFQDKRFSKLTKEEYNNPDFNTYISVLGKMKPVAFQTEQDIIKQLKPFQDGVLLEYQKQKGLFLPSVWAKRPSASDFWKGVKKKAKLKEDFVPQKARIFVFSSENVRPVKQTILKDQKRIQKAIQALTALFQENGQIIYEIDYKTGTINEKSNIVREMGTGYSLAYAYYRTHDETLRPVLKRFLDYARRISVKTEQGSLISDGKGNIKSGSTALGLLAEMYYARESGDNQFQDMREQWKKGLLSLFERGQGIWTSWENKTMSPYYEGETWLALSVYNEFYPQDKELDIAVSELNDVMYDKYVSEFKDNFFHWGNQAASIQYRLKKSQRMYDYIVKQARLYLNQTKIKPVNSSCSYAEGLAETALSLQRIGKRDYQNVLTRLENQLEIPRLLQRKPYQWDENNKIHPEMQKYLGLFLGWADKSNTRNDHTQHCLTALLKAQLVLEQMK